MSRVSAASGPYAAELSASRPKTGIPSATPICSARSSVLARGLPTSRSRIFMRRADSQFCPAFHLQRYEHQSQPVAIAKPLYLAEPRVVVVVQVFAVLPNLIGVRSALDHDIQDRFKETGVFG